MLANKAKERHWVEQAARHLGRDWIVRSERESPDFIVGEGTHQFGLEVSEVFTGTQSDAGSEMRRREAASQTRIDALRRAYQSRVQAPLRVQFVGDINPETLASVVPRLLAEDVASKPLGYHFVIDCKNGLRVHVTRAFRDEWFYVNDMAGFVDRKPMPKLEARVRQKAAKLRSYRENAGADIRLLLVANRYQNSGKLLLNQDEPSPDLCGFTIVYFFSFPESVAVFQ